MCFAWFLALDFCAVLCYRNLSYVPPSLCSIYPGLMKTVVSDLHRIRFSGLAVVDTRIYIRRSSQVIRFRRVAIVDDLVEFLIFDKKNLRVV